MQALILETESTKKEKLPGEKAKLDVEQAP
jgi:hypothetical protein